MIRGLAVKEMELSDWYKVFGRELVMGMILGVILGAIGFVRAFSWDRNVLVSMIVGISLVGVVLFGCVAGALMPFMIRSFKMDPAVSSSPFIASLVDVSGIMIYFNVAMWMTRWLGPLMNLPPPHLRGG